MSIRYTRLKMRMSHRRISINRLIEKQRQHELVTSLEEWRLELMQNAKDPQTQGLASKSVHV